MKIIQLLPTISFGDAVGNHTRAVRKILEELGYETEIFAENIDPRLPGGTAEHISKLPKLNDDDIILYHASTGTELNFRLPSYSGRKVMIYHNVTPPRFFESYSPAAEELTRSGLEGIRFLADKVDYCIAVSEFNKQDLLRMGYICPIDVCPILIPFEDYKTPPDRKVLSRCRGDGYTNLLFVGRIAPNKKHEDIIAAFCCYHKYYNEKSRLILAGNWGGMERYYERLRAYARRLGIAADVIFPGHIKFKELLAFYHAADVFVCMSEHEGFCVPLVEAMYFQVPVVAYSSSAIPDTLGKGGILLDEKAPKTVAAAIHRAAADDEIRAYIRKEQAKRLEAFSYDTVKAALTRCIERAVKG